jgi:hypothetical protein
MQMVSVWGPFGRSLSVLIFTVSVSLISCTRSTSAGCPAIVTLAGGSASNPEDELTVDRVFSDWAEITD